MKLHMTKTENGKINRSVPQCGRMGRRNAYLRLTIPAEFRDAHNGGDTDLCTFCLEIAKEKGII